MDNTETTEAFAGHADSAGEKNATSLRALLNSRYCESVFLLIMCVVVVAQSPSMPLNQWYPYPDSSVFQYIGSRILQGEMPYRDIFDHKGPLLYLIDVLGLLINQSFGIWVIELVFIVSSALMWRHILISQNVNMFARYVVLLTVLAFVGQCLQGGNLAEEYILPFLTIPIFFLCKRDACSRPFIRGVVFGICCSVIALLKINALAFLVPYAIGIAIFILRGAGRRAALPLFAGFFVGVCIVFIPVTLWLLQNDAFSDFIQDYIVYNSAYAGHMSLSSRLHSLVFFLGILVVASLVFNVASCLKGNAETRAHSWIHLFAFCSGYLVTAGTGYYFGHYALLFAPFLILPFGYAANLIAVFSDQKVKEFVASCCLLALLAFSVVPSVQSVLDTVGGIHEKSDNEKSITAMLEKYIQPNSKMAFVGESCWPYLSTGAVASSEYAYLPAHLSNQQEWFDVILDSLDESVSLVVVNDTLYGSIESDDRLNKQYVLAEQVDCYSIYARA